MGTNMKMSLLEIVQQLLSSSNSDEVNSISDTTESLQAANAVKQTYFNMLGRYDLPEHNEPFTLTASASALTPTLMFKPEGVTRIEEIWYYDVNPADSTQSSQFGSYSHGVNTDIVSSTGLLATSTSTLPVQTGSATFVVASGLTTLIATNLVTAVSGINSMTGTITSYIGTNLVVNVTSIIGSGTFSSWSIFAGGPNIGPGYVPVKVLPFVDFMQLNVGLNSSGSDVGTMQVTIPNNDTGAAQVFNFNYQNDLTPRYCTIISNYYIIFNSYDSTLDSTLQGSKTLAFGWVYPTFTLTDTFVPNLDAQQFPLLINDAKALFFYEQKQMPHMKAEEEVGRQLTSLQKWKAIANRESGPTSYFSELPNFGR